MLDIFVCFSHTYSMPKRTSSSQTNSAEHSKILLVIIVAVVAFAFGFMIARAKYKTQLNTTYNMVMEKQATINDLNAKVQSIQKILKNK